MTNDNITTDLYDEAYYAKRDSLTRSAANAIVDYLNSWLESPSSVADFGCGIGTWLSVFRDRGVKNVTGHDGPWVDTRHLVIPRECFREIRLGENVVPCEKHDLTLCLEVAEHIEPDYSNSLIETLTLSADVVLFSAAIPGQGGTNHVNEQWPAYWVEKFNHFGFDCFDVLRKVLWEEADVPFWYRQNLFVAIRKDRDDLILAVAKASDHEPNNVPSLVHPLLFSHRLRFAESREKKLQVALDSSSTVRGSASRFLVAIKRRLGMRAS